MRVINARYGNPLLPSFQSFATQILADTDVQMWADSGFFTMAAAPYAGQIATWVNRVASGPTIGQVNTSRQATPTPSAINGFGEGAFTGAQWYLLSALLGFSSPYTMACLYRAPASGNGSIFGNFSSSSQRTGLGFTGANAQFSHGSGVVSAPHNLGAVNYAEMSFDGTTGAGTTGLSLQVNGGSLVTGTTDNNTSPNIPALGAGSGAGSNPMTGGIGFYIFMAGSRASKAATLSLIRKYANRLAGLSLPV